MISSFPKPTPNLENLRKQAKTLLKQVRGGDRKAEDRVQIVEHRLGNRRAFGLQDAQCVVALECGFSSWPKLVVAIGLLHEADRVGTRYDRLRGAVEAGDLSRARAVLAEEPTLTENEPSLLHRSAALGDLATAAYLVGAGVDVNARGSSGTPLHATVSSRDDADELRVARLEIARLLLQRGANPIIPNNRRFMPLDEASVARDHALVKLIRTGVRNPKENDMTGDFGNPTGYDSAVRAIDSGDLVALRALVATHPDLPTSQGYLSGDYEHSYFAGATLLHHVAGNPIRGPLPSNLLDIARYLIEAGCEVDARTEGRTGSTTLGLVVSGSANREAGVQVALIDLLVESGADVNLENGSLMWLSLVHGETEAALALHRHGAKLDLCAAAGLGETAAVPTFFTVDGTLTESAKALNRGLGDEPDRPDADVLVDALGYAALNGHADVVADLIARGTEVSGVAQGIHGGDATALHHACWMGHLDVVKTLVEAGADLTVRDGTHNGLPIGWAEHAGHDALVDYLRRVK